MIRHPRQKLFLVFVATALTVTAQAQSHTRPKVRAITAFVRLEQATQQQEMAGALSVLRAVKGEFEKQGYEVESIRIVTQPLSELVSGQSEAQALAYLKSLSDLGSKEGFIPSLGPAMMRDTDDPRNMRLLEKALSTLANLPAHTIIADDEGIHWKVIRESAALVHYVTEHSPNSQGNFGFTATAMLKPYGPFYPGTYHTGPGRQLSIGFEGANVVQEVFAHTRGDFPGSVAELTKQLTIHAKVAETIGQRVATAKGWTFMGVDPTPAPLGDVSIGAAIETYTAVKMGSSGVPRSA